MTLKSTVNSSQAKTDSEYDRHILQQVFMAVKFLALIILLLHLKYGPVQFEAAEH